MSIKPVKGLRSYYPTDKGPIDTYQLGRNGRVEYLAAEISTDHLKKGNDTTDDWKKWAKERGAASDEPGLILSHRLGGIGTDKANLFPKSPLLDKSVWAEHEKAAVEEASEMKKWKKIKFSAKLEYKSEESTRPSTIEYQYDLPSGTILYGKVNNDEAPEPSSGDEEVEEKEAEEEESEYEEEEVEESEEEAEETVAENTTASAPEEPVEKEAEPEAPKVVENILPEVPIKTVVQPPTPPVVEKSPSPPPPPPVYNPPLPSQPAQSYTPPKVSSEPDTVKKAPSPPKSAKSASDPSSQQDRGFITKSDIIDLIPVIGSCKLALETAQAAYSGNGKLALRKAVQCGISLVADFYLGRAIARHGKILSKTVTEQTVLRFVTKAENQIIIISSFKATNQLLSTLTRVMS